MVQLCDLQREAEGEVLGQLAALYCRIWQEPPWNETHWTIERVLVDLSSELALPGAIGFAAIDSQVVGFTWGYRVTPDALRVISGGGTLDYVFVEHEHVFYIDELGVDGRSREHGIGSTLTKRLLAEVWGQGYDMVILRTDDQAAAAIKLYRRLGFVDMPVHDSAHPTRRYWVLKKH